MFLYVKDTHHILTNYFRSIQGRGGGEDYDLSSRLLIRVIEHAAKKMGGERHEDFLPKKNLPLLPFWHGGSAPPFEY